VGSCSKNQSGILHAQQSLNVNEVENLTICHTDTGTHRFLCRPHPTQTGSWSQREILNGRWGSAVYAPLRARSETNGEQFASKLLEHRPFQVYSADEAKFFMTRQQVLDLYFMDARAKLIDLAAFLDRVDRAQGEADFRLEALRHALQELNGDAPHRAEKVLLSLSDPTVQPIPAATTKAACGAWPGR
jgi:hypothetical protein